MFHGHLLKIRIHKKYVKAIFEAINVDVKKYENVSHFVRSAIIEKLRNEGILNKEGKF